MLPMLSMRWIYIKGTVCGIHSKQKSYTEKGTHFKKLKDKRVAKTRMRLTVAQETGEVVSPRSRAGDRAQEHNEGKERRIKKVSSQHSLGQVIKLNIINTLVLIPIPVIVCHLPPRKP